MVLLFCFCASKRRHTRCALVTGVQTCSLPILPSAFTYRGSFQRIVGVRLKKGDAPGLAQAIAAVRTVLPFYEPIDGYVLFPAFKPARTSVVSGKTVSVRFDRGGCRFYNNKQL